MFAVGVTTEPCAPPDRRPLERSRGIRSLCGRRLVNLSFGDRGLPGGAR